LLIRAISQRVYGVCDGDNKGKEREENTTQSERLRTLNVFRCGGMLMVQRQCLGTVVLG